MNRSRNAYKSRRTLGKSHRKPSYKSNRSSTQRPQSSLSEKPYQKPIQETPKLKEVSIPGVIKYQGYTYKYGNFNAPDLETVVRESKKYTEKGMDVHIKEINGRLYLFYRKVPKDMPLIEDPDHPAAIPKASRNIPNTRPPDDEFDPEPTREDWENNGIPPYWLDGISRSEYIRTSNPNDPLYDKDDFIFDPRTGKIKSEYGWGSLKEFPRISKINPKSLKSWIKGSLSTTGAMRRTRIENTVSNNEEEEIDEEIEEVIEEEEEIDEEIEEEIEEEEEKPSHTPTRNFSNNRNIGGIKSAVGSVGRLAKSTVAAGANSLKNYAEWVKEMNLKTAEGEDNEELDDVLRDLEEGRKKGRKYPPRGDRYPSTRGRKYSDNFDDEEEYDIEDEIQRRNEHYNKVMNRLGFGVSSQEPPDLSPEEIRRRDQQFQARANTLLAGDRLSRPPMTEEERIKAQQRYDADIQFLIGGSSRRQQQPSNPLARDADFQNASNTLMFGTLPQSRPNPYLSEPPRKQTSSNTSQVNQEINRAKQEQRYQQQQKAAEERRRAEQERLDRTMNEFMGISAPRKPAPAATQGKKKPPRQQPPQGDPIKDFLYGNLL
jgi:hypothetical protein